MTRGRVLSSTPPAVPVEKGRAHRATGPWSWALVALSMTDRSLHCLGPSFLLFEIREQGCQLLGHGPPSQCHHSVAVPLGWLVELSRIQYNFYVSGPFIKMALNPSGIRSTAVQQFTCFHGSPCARTEGHQESSSDKGGGPTTGPLEPEELRELPHRGRAIKPRQVLPKGTGTERRRSTRSTAVAHVGEGSKRVLALLGLPFNKSLLRDVDISFWSNRSSATADM